nr:MAG TPA: hypothetical protein [Caudoviricetes sp.]
MIRSFVCVKPFSINRTSGNIFQDCILRNLEYN